MAGKQSTYFNRLVDRYMSTWDFDEWTLDNDGVYIVYNLRRAQPLRIKWVTIMNLFNQSKDDISFVRAMDKLILESFEGDVYVV